MGGGGAATETPVANSSHASSGHGGCEHDEGWMDSAAELVFVDYGLLCIITFIGFVFEYVEEWLTQKLTKKEDRVRVKK
jgi:hypothetical protein